MAPSVASKPFRSQSFSDVAKTITGVTKDSTGAALGNCVVQLFQTWNDTLVMETVSDGSGNYTVYPTGSAPYYIVAYLAGGTDVAGTTVNTLGAA